MPELANVAPRSRRRPVPRSVRPAGRRAMIGIAAALAVISLAGCGKMDAALGQQWIVVQFNSNTTLAMARQVARACSQVPNLRVGPIQPTNPRSDIIESMRYNATNASDANTAQLQGCLARFPSVQGINLLDAGDS